MVIRVAMMRVSVVYAQTGEVNARRRHQFACPSQRYLMDHAGSLLGKARWVFMLEAACDRAHAVVLDAAHGLHQGLIASTAAAELGFCSSTANLLKPSSRQLSELAAQSVASGSDFS